MQDRIRHDIGDNAARFDPVQDDVFARIADRYDRLCDIFSLGIHRRWKSHMAGRMRAHSGEVVLDVASGTGDIPLRLLREGCRPRLLWVTDACPKMLGLAEAKLAGAGAGMLKESVRFARADAERLVDFADASVDVFSISFGMKICERSKVLAEAFRVLRPGGRFYCLEAARLRPPALHAAYLAYMDWCLPLIGRLAADGDASAYRYLLTGIHGFPDQEGLAAEMRGAGFAAVRYRNLTFGIVALHQGEKPGGNGGR